MREKKNKIFQSFLFLTLVLIVGFYDMQKAEAVDSGRLELGQELNPGFIEPGRSETTAIRIYNYGTVSCESLELEISRPANRYWSIDVNWNWSNVLPDSGVEAVWDGKYEVNGQRLLLPTDYYEYHAVCRNYSPNVSPNEVGVSGQILVMNMIDGRFPQCSDEIDNDSNGSVDFPRDAGCQSWSDDEEGSVKLPQCSDGLDNDGDGLIDADDLGCFNKEDDDEKDIIIQKYQCSDGIDNDGDGLIDVNDPGCLNSNDDDENNIIINPPQCASDSKIRYIQNIPDDFIFTSDIKYGEESLRVKYLQIVLAEMGPSIYPQSYISSKYYDLTKKAVQNFINFNGISGESDELIGIKTANKLNDKLVGLREDVLICGSRQDKLIDIVDEEYVKYQDANFNLPKVLMFALISAETGLVYNLNNELVSSDKGKGLTQVTSSDYVGKAYPNEDVTNAINCKNGNDNSCYEYYANTPIGLRHNIGDAFLAIKNKYLQVNKDKLKFGEFGELYFSKEDMINISALARYNGIIRQAPAIYLVNQGHESCSSVHCTNQEVYDYFWREKGINYDSTMVSQRGVFCSESGYDYCRFRDGFSNDEWLNAIREVCDKKTFSQCLSLSTHRTDDGRYLTTSVKYLTKIAEGLKGFNNAYYNDELYRKLTYADNNKVITWIASPGELFIVDEYGNQSGIVDGGVVEDIPNIIVDKESNVITHFFPDEHIRYRIKGKQEGSYGLIINSMSDEKTVEFSGIPVTSDSVHEYSVDWDVISEGQGGITMKIDNNGDGIFEYESIIGNDFKDTIAPQTTIVPDIDNWQKTDAEVVLFAEDNEGGIGVQKTEYSLDGGESWLEYKEPFIISEEGVHNLQYRSIDWFGNKEETKTAEIKIDKTAPEAKIFPRKDNLGFDIEGIDDLSGIDEIKKESETIYIISDNAGNTLKIEFSKIQEQNKTLQLRIKSLKYNENPEVNLVDNRIHYVWQEEKNGSLILMGQQMELVNIFNVLAHYNENKDETKITVSENGNEKEESYSGLKIIGFSIKQEELKFSY